jgi:hypothetical protein
MYEPSLFLNLHNLKLVVFSGPPEGNSGMLIPTRDAIGYKRLMKGITFFFLATALNVCHAQDVQLGVTYTCGGERLYLESCNIRDLSDTSTCMVAHPDRPKHNGFMAYTTETRGALKKLLPTCKQPSSEELARAKAHYTKQNDIQAANEKKANAESDAIEARAQAVIPGKKPLTPEERATTRGTSIRPAAG